MLRKQVPLAWLACHAFEHFEICFGAGSVYAIRGQASINVDSLSGEVLTSCQSQNSRSYVQLCTGDKHKFSYSSAHTGCRLDCIGLPADKSAGIMGSRQQSPKFRTYVHTSPVGRSNTQAKSFTDPFCWNFRSGSQAIDRGKEIPLTLPLFLFFPSHFILFFYLLYPICFLASVLLLFN